MRRPPQFYVTRFESRAFRWWLAAAACLVATLPRVAHAEARLIPLGVLPGDLSSAALGVSGDGQIAVGYSVKLGALEASSKPFVGRRTAAWTAWASSIPRIRFTASSASSSCSSCRCFGGCDEGESGG